MPETESLPTQPTTTELTTATPLLDSIIENLPLGYKDDDEVKAKTLKGLEALIGELIKKPKGEKVNKNIVDQMIAAIDHKLSVQVDEVLHHQDFQQLESAWRGLKFVVDKTNFRENIKIELLNVSKADLSDDFEEASEVVKSGLYKQVYSENLGVFGGKPIGAMIANYEFGPKAPDIKLLQKVASVGAMAHAPFIAAAGPQFFGAEAFSKLPNIKDLTALFEGPQYNKWQSFRDSEDARYVGLTLPRFLLRLPYSPESNPTKAFQYEENVQGSHDDYLWGNTAYTFATRLTDSFAKHRWCLNIVGPQSGGAVEDLPQHQYKSVGQTETKIPTEIFISDVREYELAKEGFIALTMRKDSDNAAFFSANSVQKTKFFGNSDEAKQDETNYRLGTKLPYMFIISRLAHYIKVLQREQLGTWKERAELQRELNTWLKQYVVDMKAPNADVRSRRPLRQAQIIVEDVTGEAGWYRVQMKVCPHITYEGANFTLSLVGKLDKE